jgi:predicted phosphoadenosine phosphosulfate sulfurtransferase
MIKKYHESLDVLTASKERISTIFDEFNTIYLSFSAGKDSTAMFHLVMDEAKKRNRVIGILFIDWECQFQLTIDHAKKMFEIYKDYIDLYWIQLEILTNNASSMYEPLWMSFDESKKDLWVRQKENNTINDAIYLPFYYKGMTFEEFVPLFGQWYSKGENCACFVGIRTQESLNRFRAIARKDISRYKDTVFTVKMTENLYNVYPIYDWNVTDIWTYYSKFKKCYNSVYDLMFLAGLSINQMRIDEPFGDEARKNLWIYHIIEPQTWAKMVARMEGVNSGSLYSQESGNILGNIKISLPKGHTWESFSMHILNTMPPKTSDHFKNKIAKYIKWYMERGYENGIPDVVDIELEKINKAPSWRLIAKCLLKNDYWCRTLGFSITKSNAYEKYMKLMKNKRNEWNILNK